MHCPQWWSRVQGLPERGPGRNNDSCTAKKVDDLHQVILGRVGYKSTKDPDSSSCITMSIVSAIISKLLSIRKSLQQVEEVSATLTSSHRWSSFSLAIFKVKCAARTTLLAYMHAAEKGPTALDELQRLLNEDALQHVSLLVDQYQYCTDVLEAMQTGNDDTITLLPLKLGSNAHQCFAALFQDLLSQGSPGASGSGDGRVLHDSGC